MDITSVDLAAAELTAGLFLLICFLCYRLLQKRRYLILLVWPVVIYFCGPAVTMMFEGAPVLGRYVFAKNVLPEILLMVTYVFGLALADRIFDLSAVMRTSFESGTIRQLARSPLFVWIFVPASFAAAALQTKMLLDFGSIFTGVYTLTFVDEGLIPYWGFLAGLYEIIFVLFVLFILSEQKGGLRTVVLGLYALTAVLRVASGTRMILVKELAVVLLLFDLQGSIRRSRLVMASLVVIVAGSAVGLARGGGGVGVFLGPLFGIGMESGLNALTLNVAYEVQDSGYVAHHANLLDTLEFIAVSAVPSFLRFGMTKPVLDALSPYNAALGYGFDSYQPVGAMSGFATLCYLCSEPFVATLALVAGIVLFLKLTPGGALKQIVTLVFCISALHFWRDPIDIAVKNTVQDILCAVALGCLPALRSSRQAVLAG
jgi:hypothetical protein